MTLLTYLLRKLNLEMLPHLKKITIIGIVFFGSGKQILPTGPGVVAVLDEPAPKNIIHV